MTWTNVCVDSLIVMTEQTSDYEYTLWTDVGDGLDLTSFFTTTTHTWCKANLAFSSWTWGNSLNTLIKADFATTKKIVMTKSDTASTAGTYTNTVSVTLDSSAAKTLTFKVKIVDGCSAITSTTVATSTQ